MSRLIDLSCRVADVHHRYNEIHGFMFGVASFRLVVDALRGRRRRSYLECAATLRALRAECTDIEPRLAELAADGTAKTTEREIQKTLLRYLHALDQSMANLLVIFERLAQDENAYRESGTGGRSGFTSDKLSYDQSLSELERFGTRLNRLFANY